jgi:hypothetical protein
LLPASAPPRPVPLLPAGPLLPAAPVLPPRPVLLLPAAPVVPPSPSLLLPLSPHPTRFVTSVRLAATTAAPNKRRAHQLLRTDLS